MASAADRMGPRGGDGGWLPLRLKAIPGRHDKRLRVTDFVGVEKAVIYLSVFLAPQIALRFGDILFTYSDFLFCLSLFLLLIGRRMPVAPLGGATPFWLFSFVLLMVGLLGSSLVHGDPLRALNVIGQYSFAYVVLVFVLMRDDQEVHRLVIIYLVGVILVVDLHGIIYYMTIGYLPGSRNGIVSGSGRLQTMLGDANLAAAINALCLPMLLYCWACGRLSALVALPMLGLLIATVLLTGSFGGFAATSLSLAVFFGSVMDKRLFGRFILVGGGVALLFYFGGDSLLPATFRDRVLVALTSGDLSQAGTFDDRTQLIYEAFEMIRNHGIILTGIGADQFRVLSVSGAPVHNMYVLLWVEGGLLALLGWLFFLLTAILLGLVSRQLGGSRHVGATLMATIAVFAFAATTNPHMYGRHWLMAVLLSLALVMAQLRERPKADPVIAPDAGR